MRIGKRFLLILAVICLVPLWSAQAVTSPTETDAPPIIAVPEGKTVFETVTVGTVISDGECSVMNGAGDRAEKIGTVRTGERYVVIGSSGDWLEISLNARVGYIWYKNLRLEEVSAPYTPPAQQLSATLSNVTFNSALYVGDYLSGTGSILTDAAVTSVTVRFMNRETGTVLGGRTISFPYSADIRELDFAWLISLLPPAGKIGTDCSVSVFVGNEAGTITAFDRVVDVLPKKHAEIPHITARCSIYAASGVAKFAHDSSWRTAWRPETADSALVIDIPQKAPAGGIQVSWLRMTDAFTVSCLDGDGREVLRYEGEPGDASYRSVFPLDETVRTVQIRLRDPDSGIVEARVYALSTDLSGVQAWEKMPDKVDLMVFSAHLDDELLWFGGAIPYYADAGRTVAVVYMTETSWVRKNEALGAMWDCGVRYHPIFLLLKDKKLPTFQRARDLWGDAALERIVETIRRYRPDVIVTHDFDGEYGHSQHKLTASLLAQAISVAADASAYPASVAEYGAWQVKKLYIHRYEQNAIYMDWDVPLPSLGGVTAIDAAYAAFENYASQLKFYNMRTGKRYDYTWFGLYYSDVGPDVEKNDFFENID